MFTSRSIKCFLSRRHGWLQSISVLLLNLVCVAPGNADITANIRAQIRNPGFVIVNNSASVPLIPLDDLETRSATTTFQGPALTVQSTLASNLSNNSIGVVGAWVGQSFEGVGSLRDAFAGGHVDYNDEIQVVSSTLAIGTPVEIQFSFSASHMVHLLHSFAGTNNNSSVDIQFNADISNQSSSANDINISSGHRLLQDATSPLPMSTSGIMTPGAPPLDVVFNSTVGETIDFHIRALANLTGNVVSTGLGNLDIQVGAGIVGLGIAFGGSPIDLDFSLESQLFAAEFPPASEAIPENASTAIPETEIWYPGDVNVDGYVDGIDFLMWQRGDYPSPHSDSVLTEWETNYGLVAGPPPPSLVGVPEPGSASLFALSAMLFLRRQRSTTNCSEGEKGTGPNGINISVTRELPTLQHCYRTTR
jgi:hypothetical protein